MERTSQFLTGQGLGFFAIILENAVIRHLLYWKLDTERIQNQNYKNTNTFTIEIVIVQHCC